MKKSIFSLLLVGLSTMALAQAKKAIDSLAGFDYLGAMEHSSHMKSDKEKHFFLEHAKRTYKISKFQLYPPLTNGANAKPPSGNTIQQGPQPTGCNNIDFESGNTTGWTIVGDAQVMTGGNDPYGGFPRVWPGGTSSLRLNDDNLSAKTNFSATATRVIPVSPSNNQFQLHFAFCLLNFPHPGNAAALFRVTFLNAANQPLACPTFSCYYANPPGQFFGMPAGVAQTAPVQGQNIGFQTYPVTYVPWQTVAMDLSLYNGQNITVQIECNWCLYNYDWAYCYIDADCASNNFTPSNNPCGNMPQQLCGPIGMQSYTWTPPAGGGAVQTTSCITAPVGGVYTLQTTPFTSCATTQNYTFALGGALPTANFVFDPACINSATSFTSTSLGNGGVIANYSWDWGDGTPVSTSTNSTMTHTFTTAGPKQVKLVVANQAGCKDSITIAVSPVNSPIAAYSYTSACVNSPLFFNSTTNLNGGPPLTSFSWEWNDATPNGSGASMSHIYTTSGNQTVKLVVTNGSGCKDSITQTFGINPSPLVDFAFNPICQGASTNFTNTTNNNGSTLASWYWDLNGDGTFDNNTISPSYVYPTSGVYNVKLIGVTDLGCSDTIIHPVNVYSKPVAQFNYNRTCLGEVTVFNDQSYLIGNNGTINTWEWDFNNNLSNFEASGGTVSTKWTTMGYHTAYLVATTSYGCKDTTSVTMYVNPSPVINFTANKTEGCEPLEVEFTNLSTIPTGSIISYSWSVGDNRNSSNEVFTHVYPEGIYNVSLSATSDSGCVAEKTITNYIHSYPTPVANFTVSPQSTTILEPLVEFTNVTQDQFTQFWWFFGDTGDADTTHINPTHYYNSDLAGNYMTTLIIRNEFGCSDTVQQLVVVDPSYVIYIPNAFTPNADGLNDVFQAKGYYIDKFEMQIFDRWGEQIFSSTDVQKGWDGTFKGKLSENGVYAWRVTVIDTKYKRHLLTGHVTLMK